MKLTKALIVLFISLFLSTQVYSQSALSAGGKLKVSGLQLTSECGQPIQLRGMSSHGIHWFPNCYSSQSLDSLVMDWGIDVFRIVAYVENSSGGYNSDPSGFKNRIDQLVDLCAEKQVYCIIDWHILSDGNPLDNLDEAKEFWEYMSATHAGKKHVLYEICNEPNRNSDGSNVPWTDIKQYADTIIPIIRANDSETVIIVGTPSWSGNPWDVVGNQLSGANAYNIMYTFHFYAGSHSSKKSPFRDVIKEIPIFVSEWGTSDASGDSGFNEGETRNWIDIFNGNNDDGITISWVNWSFADKDETSAALVPYACAQQKFNTTSQSGTLVKELLSSPADNFLSCTNEPQIITHPSDKTVSEGQDAVMSINVAGDNLSYTWYLNGDTILGAPDSNRYAIYNTTIDNNQDTFSVVVSNSFGSVVSNEGVLTILPKGPYSGQPITLPGYLQIEEYDIGGPGVTYSDNDKGNNGNELRSDDVDISRSWDTDNGYAVGWVEGGEWLEYTVYVDRTDTFAFSFRTANIGTYGDGVVSIMIDSQYVISNFTLPSTGGWVTWETKSIKDIPLEEGNHKLRLLFNAGPVNVNYIQVRDNDEVTLTGLNESVVADYTIYPNPGKEVLYVKSNSGELTNSNLKIFNSLGQIVASKEMNNVRETINTASLQPGVYLIQASSEQGGASTKWIKQ